MSRAKQFPWTDYGLAERLVAQHRKKIRYCPARKCWYIWNGKVWAKDDRLMIETLAKDTVRSMDQETHTYDDAGTRSKFRAFITKCEAAARIASMVSLARSEQEIVVTPDQLDSDPWLLNVENGTLDLKTGELHPHDIDDLITLMAPVKYDPEAKDERWENFLDAVIGDEEEGPSFESLLQRAGFSSLVGVQRDKVLLVLLGPGNTGKTTFLNALRGMLGRYADTMSSDSLLQRSFSGGMRSDLATLESRRFVAASEIEQGKKLAEGLVKALTGGDAVKASLKYENEREFQPQFTLWLAANDMALIRQEDKAMWNRFMPIPLTHVFKEGKDEKKDVKDIFLTDASLHAAVLAWVMRGRVGWLRGGIGTHPKVDRARQKQKDEMNPLTEFFQDKVVFDEAFFTPSSSLRDAYVSWCEVTDHRPINAKDFASLLREKGAEDASPRINGVRKRGWNGVKLA